MPRTRGCFSKEAGKFSSLPSAVAVQRTDSIRDFNVCSAFKKPDSPLLFKRQQSAQGGKKMMFANMIVSFKLWVNAAFLLSWHCFDTYMWVFNMLIKCLVPHRHRPLLVENSLRSRCRCPAGAALGPSLGTTSPGHCQVPWASLEHFWCRRKWKLNQKH